MNIQAYEDFLQSIDTMTIDKMIFLYEKDKEKGFKAVKSAIDEAKELGSYAEKRIALENLLDNLSEVGLFLSSKQIYLADSAFEKEKGKNERLLIAYYKEHLIMSNEELL